MQAASVFMSSSPVQLLLLFFSFIFQTRIINETQQYHTSALHPAPFAIHTHTIQHAHIQHHRGGFRTWGRSSRLSDSAGFTLRKEMQAKIPGWKAT